MQIEDFLADLGSATAILKRIPSEFTLQVLHQGFYYDNYYRVVSIGLDTELILLGVSRTKSKFFQDILEQSNQQPIGIKLFEKPGMIKRVNMQVEKISYKDINEPLVLNHLKDIGYQDELYVRHSIFVSDEEEMELTEYIIPCLALFLAQLDNKKGTNING
jgi:chorismate-pyruvate lyase